MKIRLLLTICSVSLGTFHSARGADRATYTFYKDYRAPVSAKDYVVFYARSLLPSDYLVLDLKQKKAMVYSPYKEGGLVHTHQMTDSEYKKAMALLTGDEARKIPEHSGKMALDAFEFSADGIIGGKKLKFNHILPDNGAVLKLHELYKYYLDAVPLR